MQDVPKAREEIEEGLSMISAGEAKIRHAHDYLMWKGKGESPKANGGNGSRRTPTDHEREPRKERIYIDSDDITPMFSFVTSSLDEDNPELMIARSMYGDFKVYNRLTEAQYFRLRKTYFSLGGKDI